MAGSLYGIYRASRPTDCNQGVDIAEVFKKFNPPSREIGETLTEYERKMTKDQKTGNKIAKSYQSLREEKEEIEKKIKEQEREEPNRNQETINIHKKKLQNTKLFCKSVKILKIAIDSEEIGSVSLLR